MRSEAGFVLPGTELTYLCIPIPLQLRNQVPQHADYGSGGFRVSASRGAITLRAGHVWNGLGG